MSGTAGLPLQVSGPEPSVAPDPASTNQDVATITVSRRVAARRRTLRQMLVEEPARFAFDAAIAAMMRASGQADPGSAIRFHAPSGLAFVAADILAVEPAGDRFHITTGMLGLTGPGGLLPRPYTEAVNSERRRRSPALAAFFDVLAQRALTQFAAAGIKYRPHRLAEVASIAAKADLPTDERPKDGLRDSLLALTGHATPGMTERLLFGTDPLFFYAGAFASRTRSAERLTVILSDWLGQAVEIEEFAGHWLDIDADQMTSLPRIGQPGRFNQLGINVAVGARAWDIQSRIVIRIGPLRLDAFLALLPGGAMLRQLAALGRAYLDGAAAFTINPVLAADAVPSLALSTGTPAYLGWNTWLPTGGPRCKDGSEARFGSDAALDGIGVRPVP